MKIKETYTYRIDAILMWTFERTIDIQKTDIHRKRWEGEFAQIDFSVCSEVY